MSRAPGFRQPATPQRPDTLRQPETPPRRWPGAAFRHALAGLALALLLVLAGCGDGSERLEAVRFLVGVSQANLSEPWRIAMVDEIRSEAAQHGDLRVLFIDAADSPRKQIADVNTLLDYGINLLIISPADAAALTPVVQSAYRRIPVIILDRAVDGYDYTLYIGPDNESIGRRAGAYVDKLLGRAGGQVLLVNGVAGSPPTVDRVSGFRQALQANPAVQIAGVLQGDWLRDRTEALILQEPDRLDGVEVIFAQNDDMARGAAMALARLGRQDIRILGVDGLAGPRGGLELVASGLMEATFTCPTGGREAMRYAMDILKGAEGIPKKVILRTQTVTRHELAKGALAPPVPLRPASQRPDRPIILGFAQVGAESDWRLANTSSIKEAAAHQGIDLRFADGQQDDAIQKAAIRQFIADRVDVIAFSPRLESGWEEVLNEAKAAGIPVILTDRSVDIKDDSLWVTFMGSDFVEEGRRAARWLVQRSPGTNPVGVVELLGTRGSAPTIDRDRGFREVLDQHKRFRLLDSQTGDFTFEGGKAAMQALLARHGRSIQAVFSQNDNMALGAIQALEEAGRRPGQEVLIVSIDAVRKAFEAMIAGKLNCTVECNPLLGPQLMKAVQDYMDGKELPARIITSEGVFPAETAATELPRRQY